MAELIDTDALIDWLSKHTGFRGNCEDCTDIDCLDCIIENAIKNAPTIDAVPVVRCKDCIHFDGLHGIGGDETGKVYCYGYCYHWDYEPGMSPNQVDADDFCSYGERRTDND